MKERIKKLFSGMRDSLNFFPLRGSPKVHFQAPFQGTKFILAVSENAITLVKLKTDRLRKRSVILSTEKIFSDADENDIAKQLKELLTKQGYSGTQIILSLPRNKVTCRHVKVPSVSEAEIEKMLSLQAWNYLPFPAEELVTAHQSISVDKDGFTHTSLIILHKRIIDRFLRILRAADITDFVITLSSFGLSGLYGFLDQGLSAETILAVGINSHQAELAVVARKKMVFSRSFRFNKDKELWQALFTEEVRKTLDAYVKETGMELPEKIVLFGEGEISKILLDELGRNFALSVEILPYSGKIDIQNADGENANDLRHPGVSLSALIGLGLLSLPSSINLLPSDLKAAEKQTSMRREIANLSALFLGTVLIFGLGMGKTLHNKEIYLKFLNTELNKSAAEAMPLEYADKRLKLLENRSKKGFSGLGFLSELHNIIPEDVVLTNFEYEDNGHLILKGQAKVVDGVFAFAYALKNSLVFKDMNVDVRYASQRKTKNVLISDFEIVCTVRSARVQTAH
ncbi:MAG: pilus assembly protein PilM [Candidatus Omnitrophica bacterium]|nr:pilus assembly protein PilM [Candidatus Omnitrophota bacterium]